jgi:nitrogen fixation protein NifU and related proteins
VSAEGAGAATAPRTRDDLYHRAIVELARQAAGAVRLDAPQASAMVDNPLCGDRVTIELALADGRVQAVGHQVRGCMLCQAAAAAIAARAPGQTPAALRAVAGGLERAVRTDPAGLAGLWSELEAFAPVHRHKSRHDCVLLPFQALVRALDRAGDPSA